MIAPLSIFAITPRGSLMGKLALGAFNLDQAVFDIDFYALLNL